MPEPTASELAHEAEQEAAVFAQAVHVEKLLSLLRAFDPAKDNLADNEEIQVRDSVFHQDPSVESNDRNYIGQAWDSGHVLSS